MRVLHLLAVFCILRAELVSGNHHHEAEAASPKALRRRCVTEPETGFGFGRWVEGPDPTSDGLAALNGLEPNHPVVR